MHTHDLLHTQDQDTSPAETPAAPEQETKELSPEEQETRDKLIQMMREGKKPVFFDPPHSPQALKLLDQSLARLDELSTKISGIRTEVNKQSEHISSRLKALEGNPVVTIDSENAESKKGVAQYTELLDRILEEITYEQERLNGYRTLDKKTIIPVWMAEPDAFDDYIRHKVNLVKKQIKKIERDLSVSFSRYQFSFEKRQENLAHIEALVAYNLKLKEAQEAQKDASGQEAQAATEPAQ